ncbi:MAG: hypothetical protein ACRDNS_33630 [Trebonia sp.]
MIRRWSLRVLDAFNSWFVSDGGVWQTFGVTLAIVVLEQLFPHADPDHFACLYALTVYSGVTQPALARAGRVADVRQERALKKIEALEQQVAGLVAVLTAKEDQELAILQAEQGDHP